MNLPDLSQAAFPLVPSSGYDLIVIGSGPGGEACAVRAAQLGQRVAVIEKKSSFGGPTGLTSKAVREATKRICRAVDQIGGDRRRQVKGLWRRSFPALKTEAEVFQVVETRDKLAKYGVDLFVGACTLIDTSQEDYLSFGEASGPGVTTLRVCRPSECIDLSAKHVCIATGSRPSRPAFHAPGVALPFDSSTRIVTASEMGAIKELPNAVAIIGGGVIAVEYATVLAELGVGVSLICPEASFMSFLDPEIRSSLKRRMKDGHVLFVHEAIREIKVGTDDATDPLKVILEPRLMEGKGNSTRQLPERRLTVDLVLYSGGRDANSDGLGLEDIGIQMGKYGRILVGGEGSFRCRGSENGNYSVHAIGDVIGAGLASTAQQQGRLVAESIFGQITAFEDALSEQEAAEEEGEEVGGEGDDVTESDDFFRIEPAASAVGSSAMLFGASSDAPLTLWTLPEIAQVGMTAVAARAFEAESGHAIRGSTVEGYGYFKDMARGRLSGEMDGYLKVVAWRKHGEKQHTIVGVQILGEGANELIQLGSILLHSGSTIEQVSRTPFAAVTLSALYQMACDDAILRARALALAAPAPPTPGE